MIDHVTVAVSDLQRRKLFYERALAPLPFDQKPYGQPPVMIDDFMNAEQIAYFRHKLLGWKDEILKESKITLQTPMSATNRSPECARAPPRTFSTPRSAIVWPLSLRKYRTDAHAVNNPAVRTT